MPESNAPFASAWTSDHRATSRPALWSATCPVLVWYPRVHHSQTQSRRVGRARSPGLPLPGLPPDLFPRQFVASLWSVHQGHRASTPRLLFLSSVQWSPRLTLGRLCHACHVRPMALAVLCHVRPMALAVLCHVRPMALGLLCHPCLVSHVHVLAVLTQ